MRYGYLLIVAALIGAISLSAPSAQQSVFVPATTASTPVGGAITIATQLIAGLTGKRIYVTGLALVPVATSQVTITSGTGTNCGTGTTTPTGKMIFAAGQTLAHGVGNGAILVLPTGDSLCITIATAAAPGYLDFSQF